MPTATTKALSRACCRCWSSTGRTIPEQQLELWMTLFDLYRATGQQDRFESLAIDLRRSTAVPPHCGSRCLTSWACRLPRLTRLVTRRGAEFSWNAPQRLAVSSVAALQASVERAASPWTLAWSRIAGIDDAAVPLLADLFTRWADKQGQFVFSGVDRLETLLEIMTQSGDRTSGTEWWRLRMSALCLMGRPDEFELVALDYCVTFEVSPPSWVAPSAAIPMTTRRPTRSCRPTSATCWPLILAS